MFNVMPLDLTYFNLSDFIGITENALWINNLF